MNCLYCNNYISTGKGVGTNATYCKIECWFQAAANEYRKAYDALMAIERPATDVPNVLAEISAEFLAENPEVEGCFEEDEGESFDAFMMRTGASERIANSMIDWAEEQGYDGLDEAQFEQLARYGAL